MNVKIVKGPLFEQKQDDVYRYIQKILKQQVKPEKKVKVI